MFYFISDFPMDEYYQNCGNTYRLIQKPWKMISPYYSKKQYGENVTCKWTFIGDTNCTPEFSCRKFELRKLDDDCSTEYVKVSDGFGGEQSFCGKQTFEKPIRASQGTRDLFVEFKSAEDAKFPEKTAGFFCEAKCSKNIGELIDRLCGIQNKDDRIVGGEDAKMNEFPWQTAIILAGTRSPMCGGSVINDRFILTAAHCFALQPKKVKAEAIEVLIHAWLLDQTLKGNWADKPLGELGSIQSSGYNLTKVTDEQEHSQRFKVAEIINHPLFTSKYDYDVSLLRLEKKIDLSAADAPTPICLPGPGQYEQTFEAETPTVIGWGMAADNAGGTTRVLQKLKVPVINLKVCQSWMSSVLTQRMLCAGYENGEKDACMGDSGGPLGYQQPNKQWKQIGVVSWGEGCARKHRPGYYSRLTELIQWVNHHTLDNSATWCKDTKA
ncbi:Plasma kallikrein [Folsomia candida]|uniref:Vitamin K-dependent protein C n=1 Tax=Folsomia candida TaxID=158441 RepID=A0A226DAJ1_FOLCA|nr:Plasma kallikrein [Folsomia candida]